MLFFHEPLLTISTGVTEVAPLMADSAPGLDIKINFQPHIGVPAKYIQNIGLRWDATRRSGSALVGNKTKLNYIAVAPSTWITLAPSPIPRFEAQEAVVNGKLYVFGGFVNSKLEATKRSDVYDLATDKWTQLPDLPQPITHAGVAVDGNTIYMAGGFVGNWPTGIAKTVLKYNVTSKTWSMGPSLPQPRGAGALVRLGRELHFFGGLNANKTVDKGDHWVFNLDSGKNWVSKAPLPNPRNHLGYVVNGGKIYAIGGQHLLDEKHKNQSEVDVYNPLTNVWTKVASLPIPRSHTHNSTFVRNGKIVIVGGQANGRDRPTTLADVSEYDPKLNKWVTIYTLPEPRQAAVAALINNRIIVTTGTPTVINPKTTTWILAK